MITSRALHRGRNATNAKGEICEIDSRALVQAPSKTYPEYIQEIERAGSATMTELSASEIQAERARIEEKSGVKGYDYGNSWAKLV